MEAIHNFVENFKYFVEDIFGFEDVEAKKAKDEDLTPDDDDLPIKPFSVQWLMDTLARKKIDGRIRTSSAFMNEIVWGDKQPGAVRVRMMPNILVFIERLIEDNQGQRMWIVKRVFKPDIKKYAGYEEIVAADIFKEIEPIYFDQIEVADEKYEDLLVLTKRMATRIRVQAPNLYSYQDTKEVNPNYYIIYFAIRNVGVGKLATRTTHIHQSPEATIDLHFNKERGLIHIILSTVSVGGDGNGGWEMDVPYLDGWFSPVQKKDEIIDTVATTLKFY